MLIQITEQKGQQVVSSKELYETLGLNKSQYSRWANMNIVKNKFAMEDTDWTRLDIMSKGNASKDYAITLDFAKRLAMMAKSAKGEEIRNYFIEMEKKAKTAPTALPQTQGEMILMMAQGFVEQERQMKELDQRVKQIEAQTATRPEYMTIMGFAILQGVQIGLTTAATIGRKAAKICKENSYPIEKIKDPRFGLVGSYPEKVLKQVFSETI